jgi:hypothetical protein
MLVLVAGEVFLVQDWLATVIPTIAIPDPLYRQFAVTISVSSPRSMH